MLTQDNDPMIIPFEPESTRSGSDDGDNRASAAMAALLVIFGSIVMAISLWGFLPTTTSPHDQISTPIRSGIPMVRITEPYSGKPRVASVADSVR